MLSSILHASSTWYWWIQEKWASSAAGARPNRLEIGVLYVAESGADPPRVIAVRPRADGMQLRARYCRRNVESAFGGGVLALDSARSRSTSVASCAAHLSVDSIMCVVYYLENERQPRYYACLDTRRTDGTSPGLAMPPWAFGTQVVNRKIQSCGIVLPCGAKVELTKQLRRLRCPASEYELASSDLLKLLVFLVWQLEELRLHGNFGEPRFTDCSFWGKVAV